MTDALRPLGDIVVMSSGKSIVPGGVGRYPVYGSNGLIGGANEYLFEAGCILGRVGAYCGSVELSLGPFWASDNTIVVLARDPQSTSLRFLYYALKAADLNKYAGGAAQPLLTQRDLRPVAVYHPAFTTQRKIAAILSAYDDLIENNSRRIKFLEEIVRRVYREWLVDFRYPGHESVQLVSSELGQIPRGWRCEPLRELAEEMRASVDPESVDSDTPYVGLEHMHERSIAIADWGMASDAGSRKYLFLKGDVLFGKIRPYFHKVVVPPVDGICSTDAIVIRSRDPGVAGLVLAVVSSDPFVQEAVQTSQGTKMPRANWTVLERYLVAVPPTPLLGTFEALITDTVALIHCLVMSNRNLRATRDLLLPRLISGEVDVTHLDIAMPEAAA